MRRLLTIVTCLLITGMALADKVSEMEALKKAQAFMPGERFEVQKYSTSVGGKTVEEPFYIFNATNGRGFVLVSAEDRTTPILGYSTNGNIDLDNIPDNLRYWLQSYADEIAWVRENNIQTILPIKAKTRATSHATNTIDPLIKTHWNQTEPYNNLCPEYVTGYRSVTGCVATAMAQVMKYHQWPTAATKPIPAYEWRSKWLPAKDTPLPAVIFNWANMENSYTSSATEEQKTAVATLMQYCGYSVKMNYGPSSGAQSSDIDDALKEYFDYNATTTYVSRSFYTYDKWVDMIYYELEHKRPVLYSGQSSGGGHAFICDGYEEKNGTDYFHINWGWGGMSDNYFVLSALDPDEQGVGGSTSTDGYRFGQGAIIGIQPSTGTGTLSNITANVVNLKINSISASPSQISLGQSVTVTLNVTNNSSDDYDGELLLIDNNKIGERGLFVIAHETTQDCNITFTPTTTGKHEIEYAIPRAEGGYSAPYVKPATFIVIDETPRNVTASNITSNSAELSWTQDLEVTAWKICLNDDENNLIDANSNPFTLTGLSPETQYTVKVGSIVGSDIKWSATTTFATESLYPAPTDLTISEVSSNSAIASWTGSAEATGYNLCYGLVSEDVGTPTWLQYDNNSYKSNLGLGLNEYTWGVKYPASMITGNKLTKVSFYETSFNAADITINIYSGGDSAPGTLLYTEVVTPQKKGFHEVTLTTPVSITPEEDLWITLTEAGSHALIYCESKTNDPNNTWLYYGGGWVILSNKFYASTDRGWMIRGCIEQEGVDWSDPITNVTSPYKITGLSSDKNYKVKVQAVYPEITSDWITSSTFTTYKDVTLADDATDNSDIIELHNNEVVSVRLTNRTLYKDGKWNTICLPFALSDRDADANNITTGGADGKTFSGTPLEGAIVMELDVTSNYDNNDGTLYLIFKPAYTIAAGTPYIIKWADDTDVSDPVFNGVTIDKTMHDISFTGGKFSGTYNAQTFEEENKRILYFGESDKLYYPKAGSNIGTSRAYLLLDEGITVDDDVKKFVLNFGSDNEITEAVPMPGDANNDGTVTVTDAALTLSACNSEEVPQGFDKNNADMNGDNEITTNDVVGIMGLILGSPMPDTAPIPWSLTAR